jgi:O-antigen/teichoic acid export membrane protein
MSLKRNTLWNLAGSAIPLLAAVVCIPITLRRLGDEAFGVLTLVWGLIGYFSLFDLGVGRALTYRLSLLTARGQKDEVEPTIQAALVLTLATGIVGAMVVGGLSQSLVTRWLKIGPALQPDALLAFFIAAAGVIPATMASGLRGGLEGLERFAASNASRMVLGLLMFVLPVWAVLVHGPNLWVITLYLVAARFLVVAGMAAQLKQYVFAGAWRPQRKYLASLWSYGLWVSITGIVGPLMVYGDRFFVSAAVGAQQLTLYAIPQEGLFRLLLIPAALASALLPRMAAMGSSEVATVYRYTYRKVTLYMLGVCLFAAAAAYPALSVWLSPEFARSALPIVLVMCLGIWINSMAVVPYTLMHAKGNPRLTAIFHLGELCFYVVALWQLSTHFGLVGAAWAWVARVALDWVLLQFAVRRLYGV